MVGVLSIGLVLAQGLPGAGTGVDETDESHKYTCSGMSNSNCVSVGVNKCTTGGSGLMCAGAHLACAVPNPAGSPGECMMLYAIYSVIKPVGNKVEFWYWSRGCIQWKTYYCAEGTGYATGTYGPICLGETHPVVYAVHNVCTRL